MSNKDIIEIDCEIHHKTNDAILVSEDGEEDNAVWVPISQIKNWSEIRNDLKKGVVLTIDIPEWLALDKGFI